MFDRGRVSEQFIFGASQEVPVDMNVKEASALKRDLLDMVSLEALT